VIADTGGWSAVLDVGGNSNDSLFKVAKYNQMFTSGFDLGSYNSSYSGQFTAPGTSNDGGATYGDANYASISLNGADGVYESVGQFHIGSSELWLIALAKNDDNSALSISAGKTAIDGAAVSAVPEPSSHLALLALGAGGLTLRRRLKRAA